MIHVAIMSLKLGFLPKILSGEKTIESRWLLNRGAPWGKVSAGDTIYFKDSGRPVTAMAKVCKVLKFECLDPGKIKKLLAEYGGRIGIEKADTGAFYRSVEGKRYAVLMFLEDAKSVEPFTVDKEGYGAMAAWMAGARIPKP